MKVAVYCRVSGKEQEPKFQENLILEYCKRLNHEVYEIYTDIYTGTSDNRPSFNKLLEDMRQYKFEAIIVTKLDRIGRSLKHLLSLFDELNAKGIHFIALSQNIDTISASGKLQLQILGAFAEFERNLISERTKEALRDNEKVGKRGKDKKIRDKSGYFKRWRGGGKKATVFSGLKK